MPIPSDFLSFPLFLTPHFFLSYLYLEPGLFLFSLSFHYQVLFLFLGFSPSHALPHFVSFCVCHLQQRAGGMGELWVICSFKMT